MLRNFLRNSFREHRPLIRLPRSSPVLSVVRKVFSASLNRAIDLTFLRNSPKSGSPYAAEPITLYSSGQMRKSEVLRIALYTAPANVEMQSAGHFLSAAETCSPHRAGKIAEPICGKARRRLFERRTVKRTAEMRHVHAQRDETERSIFRIGIKRTCQAHVSPWISPVSFIRSAQTTEFAPHRTISFPARIRIPWHPPRVQVRERQPASSGNIESAAARKPRRVLLRD